MKARAPALSHRWAERNYRCLGAIGIPAVDHSPLLRVFPPCFRSRGRRPPRASHSRINRAKNHQKTGFSVRPRKTQNTSVVAICSPAINPDGAHGGNGSCGHNDRAAGRHLRCAKWHRGNRPCPGRWPRKPKRSLLPFAGSIATRCGRLKIDSTIIALAGTAPFASGITRPHSLLLHPCRHRQR